MRGLNVTVNIVARAQGADDAVGGSVRSDSLRYASVLARISNVPNPTLLAQQGYEGKDLHRIVLYPDAYPNIEREDIVVPQSGRWQDARFKVIEVRPSSLATGHPRSHIQLLCERLRYAHENVPEA